MNRSSISIGTMSFMGSARGWSVCGRRFRLSAAQTRPCGLSCSAVFNGRDDACNRLLGLGKRLPIGRIVDRDRLVRERTVFMRMIRFGSGMAMQPLAGRFWQLLN